MKTNRKESEVLGGVLGYLSTRGDFYCWRQGNFAGSLPGGYMHATKGVADILGVLSPTGKFVAIEVKREIGGKVSASQLAWGANVIAAGGVYVVARSIADVEAALGPPGPRIVLSTRKRIYPR